MLKAIGNKRIQKIMLGNKGRQEYVARGYNLFYREFIKQATGTDIALTDSKRDTGKIIRVEGNSTQVVTVTGKNKWANNTSINLNNTTKTYNYNNQTIPVGTYNFSADWSNIVLGSNAYIVLFAELYYEDLTNNPAFAISGNITANGRFNKSIVIPKNVIKVVLKLASATYTNGGSVTLSNIQLEQGSTATAYTPFVPNSPSPDYISPVVSSADNGLTIRSSSATGTSDKVVTLPTGFVGGKLPNGTMDTLEPISNVMNAVKRINKLVFNGSESGWAMSGLSVSGYVGFYITISPAGLFDKLGYCNNFKILLNSSWNGLVAQEFIQSTGNNIGIRLLASRLTTQDVAGFKTWLASNNVSVYYELATPVYTPISDINIDTYPNNTITSLSSVKPNMTVKYLEK